MPISKAEDKIREKHEIHALVSLIIEVGGRERFNELFQKVQEDNIVETTALIETATLFLDGAITAFDFVNKVAVIGKTVVPGEFDAVTELEEVTDGNL